MWRKRFGNRELGWRPVEPFEKGSSSYSDTEVPPKIPSAAVSYPFLFTDSVGDLGLAGGTPKRFGGKWDCTQRQPSTDEKPARVVKNGPHDCYCEIGFGAWSMAGKARTVNHGLVSNFKREFWTNTPGCPTHVLSPATRSARSGSPTSPRVLPDLPTHAVCAGSLRSSGTSKGARTGSSRRSSRSWPSSRSSWPNSMRRSRANPPWLLPADHDLCLSSWVPQHGMSEGTNDTSRHSRNHLLVLFHSMAGSPEECTRETSPEITKCRPFNSRRRRLIKHEYRIPLLQ